MRTPVGPGGETAGVNRVLLVRRAGGAVEARECTDDGTTVQVTALAAGEVAGFGGGGMHGYRALEGTFLGGCLFSGRTAARAAGAG